MRPTAAHITITLGVDGWIKLMMLEGQGPHILLFFTFVYHYSTNTVVPFLNFKQHGQDM